jgi:hypothetical protein
MKANPDATDDNSGTHLAPGHSGRGWRSKTHVVLQVLSTSKSGTRQCAECTANNFHLRATKRKRWQVRTADSRRAARLQILSPRSLNCRVSARTMPGYFTLDQSGPRLAPFLLETTLPIPLVVNRKDEP